MQSLSPLLRWTQERLQLLKRYAVSLQVLLAAVPVEKGAKHKESTTRSVGTDSESGHCLILL